MISDGKVVPLLKHPSAQQTLDLRYLQILTFQKIATLGDQVQIFEIVEQRNLIVSYVIILQHLLLQVDLQ